MPRLAGVLPQVVQAAIAELTTYYREYGRATEKTAPALAEAMIRDIMTVGHSCG
jgi:hypothetical protein